MCQDSNAQVTYPVTGLESVCGKGFAYCGSCGHMVKVVYRLGDTNEIPFYSDHKTF